MMVLVTVESPRGRLTLAVPDDAPVEALLCELVEACRCEGEAARWSLRARGGPELDRSRSLDQNGVYQGAILELAPEDSQRPAARSIQASWSEVVRHRALRAVAAGLRSLQAVRMPAAGAPEQAVASASVPKGLLIAVLGTERQAGASTVAALLAILLARLRPQRVAVVDADPPTASVSVSLAAGRRSQFAELAAAATPAGAESLPRRLAVDHNGLLVLPAPLPGDSESRLQGALYTALLAQLGRSVEIAVADCGPAQDAAGQAALAPADLGVLVCMAGDVDVGTVKQQVVRMRQSCRSVVVVVNRAKGDPPPAPGADATLRLSEERASSARLAGGRFVWEASPRSWRREVPLLAEALLTGRAATRWDFSTEAVAQLRDS